MPSVAVASNGRRRGVGRRDTNSEAISKDESDETPTGPLPIRRDDARAWAACSREGHRCAVRQPLVNEPGGSYREPDSPLPDDISEWHRQHHRVHKLQTVKAPVE